MKRRRRKPPKSFKNARISDGLRTPLNKLPLPKRAYVVARAAGDSVAEAAKSSVIAYQTAKKLEGDKDVQAAYRQLVRSAIPAETLVALLAGGCVAEQITRDEYGKIVSKDPDWKTRRPYIEMAAEHGGYFEKKADAASAAISVTVNHIGGQKEFPVIDAKIPVQ